jgi:glycosyltransferase involved in cell wall biosynthesis
MGWTPPVLWERLPAARRRFTGWINSVDELHRALDFHVGVIPLRNMTFNMSKSEIKFTELSALGIPAIASSAGPYAASVQDGDTGLLVHKPGDWNRHLRDLVHDEAHRDAIGKAAKAWAATRAIEGNAHLWEAAYAT